MEKKNKGKFLIKVCCVIASFCLWLYITNVENPISTHVIRNVPVTLTNLDSLAASKLTVIPNQTFSVSISVRGTALEVMKAKASDFKIVADMSEYALKDGDNRIPVEIQNSPSNVNIENNNNLWIDVQIDKLYQKDFPIKVKVQGKPKTGYYYIDPDLSESEATVSGAYRYVSNVSGLVAVVNVENLNKDISSKAQLEAVDKNGKVVNNVSINPEKINVTVPIKKSKTVGINVVTTGKQQNSVDVKGITAVESSVDIIGDYDIVKNISTINTKPIDLSSITGSNTISVKLDLPSGVSTLNGKDSVDVKVSTDSIIQKVFSTSINVTNLPSGYSSSLSANTVNITLSGDSTVINALNNSDIKATIDATNFKEGVNNGTINVVAPQGTTQSSIQQAAVNVTLVKNK